MKLLFDDPHFDLKGATRAYRDLEKTGGWSRNFMGETMTKGFAVGGVGRVSRVKREEISHPRHVQEVVNHNIDLQPGLYRSRNIYSGGWHNEENGEVYVEPSENIHDREEAIAAARARNQISIWDVEKGEEVNTGGTGE